MSGAGSFFLGLFGLGASAGISAGQSISQKKAVHEAVEEMGYVGTPDVLRMRERVRKEWWDIPAALPRSMGSPCSCVDIPHIRGFRSFHRTASGKNRRMANVSFYHSYIDISPIIIIII